MATKKVKTVELEDVVMKKAEVLREKDTYRTFIMDYPDASTNSVSYYVPEIKTDSDGMYCEISISDGGSATASLSYSAFDDEFIYNRSVGEDENFEDRLDKMLSNVDNLYRAVAAFKESVEQAASALRIARKVNK